MVEKNKGESAMSGLYKEANYENSIVELFRNMGYHHVYGPKIERDFYSPLYDEELIAALYRLNPSMPEAAIQDAFYKLKNFENAELVQKNELFMNYLQNGIEVKYFVNDEECSGLVYLLDYKKPDNNSFVVANQWTFIENSNKRPDVILFLNGLPLVLIELNLLLVRRQMLLKDTCKLEIICKKFHPCLFIIAYALLVIN